MDKKELEMRRLVALTGGNPYSPIFNTRRKKMEDKTKCDVVECIHNNPKGYCERTEITRINDKGKCMHKKCV